MELQIIKHSDVLFRDVLRAIVVKSVAWPHPIESQLKWIVDNMKPEDMHVLLSENGKDVAYMSLTPVSVKLNERIEPFLGIGCVCTAVKGMGYGNLLMSEVNAYLEKNNFKGLLFCRDRVVKFYQKNNWQLIQPERVSLKEFHEGVLTMVYNCEEVKFLDFSDRDF